MCNILAHIPLFGLNCEPQVVGLALNSYHVNQKFDFFQICLHLVVPACNGRLYFLHQQSIAKGHISHPYLVGHFCSRTECIHGVV